MVGVDFSGNTLKFAQVKVSINKIEVDNLLSRDISGLSDIDISKAIRSCFNESQAKSLNILNIIPSHLVITKNIEVPSVDLREIKEIISLQAGRHTPYSREEIIVDFIDIGTHKRSYTKILLVIVARSVVKRQFEILNKAGLKLERVLLASEGFAWFVSRMLKLEGESSPVSIVHIDESFADFTVVFRNKAIFIRSIPIGATHLIGEKEKYQGRFLEELKRSLEAYQIEDVEKTPNALIFTGAIEELKDLENVLNNTLHLPVRPYVYLENLIISDSALKAAYVAKRLSFFNVIAPLLASEEMKVDLIPEEIKLRKALEERGKDLIKTGVFILSVFILIFLILITRIYFKSAYLRALNTRYQSLDKEAQRLENDFSRVSQIRNYLSSRGYSLEVLAELYDITPQDLELSDIRFEEQRRFSVRGTAESMSTVFSFVDSMGKSKFFQDVKTKYTTKRKAGLKDVTDFEITSLLNK